MKKRSMQNATQRSNASIHGRPIGDRSANNPPVHSKNTRRYGTNSSTGHQPTSLRNDNTTPGAASVKRESPHGTPRGQQVGWAGEGKSKFTRPSYPLASKGAVGDGAQFDRAPTSKMRR